MSQGRENNETTKRLHDFQKDLVGAAFTDMDTGDSKQLFRRINDQINRQVLSLVFFSLIHPSPKNNPGGGMVARYVRRYCSCRVPRWFDQLCEGDYAPPEERYEAECRSRPGVGRVHIL